MLVHCTPQSVRRKEKKERHINSSFISRSFFPRDDATKSSFAFNGTFSFLKFKYSEHELIYWKMQSFLFARMSWHEYMIDVFSNQDFDCFLIVLAVILENLNMNIEWNNSLKWQRLVLKLCISHKYHYRK